MRKFRLASGAAIVALAGLSAAWAAGIYEGFPATTVAITGVERFAVDTLLSGGQQPQTQNITTGQMATYTRGLAGASGDKNLLIGGDFGINLWQRGTTSGDIANTLTYSADRWWNLGGASSAINVTKQTGAADIIAGTAGSLRFQRKSGNTDTAAICMGQALTSGTSTQLQGATVVLSFWALKGALFSDANSDVSITLASGTGASESAANFAAGSWTGYAAGYTGNTVVTTTWTQYTVSAVVPATATQYGVKFCFTPVGTAGATDYVEFANMQLEIVPTGTTLATTFERRYPAYETLLEQHYYYQVNEGAATVRYWSGLAITTSTAHIFVTFPTSMRVAPTAAITVGTFTCVKSDGATTTGSALASVASSLWTGGATLLCTVAATPLTAGNATALLGGGGSGIVAYSAEL